MFTIKAMGQTRTAWISGVTEIVTLVPQVDDDLYGWVGSRAGEATLEGTGDRSFREAVPIGADQPWTLLRVTTAECAYNLVVPTGVTFIMNDAGATIDRI